MKTWFPILASGVLGLLACEAGPSDAGGQAAEEDLAGGGSLGFVVSAVGTTCSGSADSNPFDELTRLVIQVTAPEDDAKVVASKEFAVGQGTTSVSLTVPVGRDYTVTLKGFGRYDGDIPSWYARRRNVDVRQGSDNPPVEMVLARYGRFTCLTPAQNLTERMFPALVDLGDGRVLIAGGFQQAVPTGAGSDKYVLDQASKLAFIYDSRRGTLTQTANAMNEGRAAASARKNAADEKSPGTSISSGSSRSHGATVTAGPETSIRAPIARSIRSVWSRVSVFSITVTGPLARSPASNRADFTCADGIGDSYRNPRRHPPWKQSGARVPFRRADISAPICASGETTRSIGLDRSDSSPVITAKNGCPARSPAPSLIVVPELPASSTSEGSASPRSPTPRTITSSASRTSTPRARIIAAVRATSAARRRPRILLWPPASPARIRARWLMDLSPGTRRTAGSCLVARIADCSITRTTVFSLWSVRA